MWYQQQRCEASIFSILGCDLLKNIYLCGINNNWVKNMSKEKRVVICLKISIFVVSTTTVLWRRPFFIQLWFAWKYLSLWYQQQLRWKITASNISCDLLENIYLCGINNNKHMQIHLWQRVVICLKISTFVVSTTTHRARANTAAGCDLLKNIYLCGINNNG